MAHPLSALGVVHTIISLAPLVAGVIALVRRQVIDPRTRAGLVYLAGLTLSVLTSFGLSSSGGFNAGHALGILALLAAFGSIAIARLTFLGSLRPYLAALGMSFSFFLLLVPGINETLTRLPTTHPLATGPESPVVQTALLTWLVTFVVGFVAQVRLIQRRARKTAGG